MMSRDRLIGAMLAAILATSGVNGQEPVVLDELCSFHSDALEDVVYLFDSDEGIYDHVERMLHDRSVTDFAIRAANVAPAVAAFRGGERLLLYDQFTFAELERTGTTNWSALTKLAHQLGHHVAEHRLTRDPARRLASELEADRFAGIVLNQLGASLEEAQLAYQEIDDAVRDIYPGRRERLEAVAVGWQAELAAQASGYNSTELTEVPDFPWLPPRPSARTTLPEPFLRTGSHVTLFGEAAAFLEAALKSAGYANMSYYSAPSGFALVAQLEQTETTGEPKSGTSRWLTKVESSRVFSFGSYIRALFSAPRGRFRLMVFLVTDRAVRHDSGVGSIEFEVAKDWLWAGGDRLPPSVGQQPYTNGHACTALIYEFEHEGPGREAVLLNPSTLNGRQHLEKAAIWEALQP